MIAVYLGGLLLLLASTAVGTAICALAGRRDAPAWAPAAGLAALMVLAKVAMDLPGRATLAAVVVAVATVASFAALAVRPVRDALLATAVERLPLAAGTLAIACIPFLASGRAGILGAGDNNDMSAHLTAAWWLDTRFVVPPVAAPGDRMLDEGYPLGPHALAQALSHATGISLVHAFDALTVAVPAFLALAVLAAIRPGVPLLARWVAAALVGLAYLPVSYLAQGAFKETLMGLFLVAFALAVRSLFADGRRPTARSGLPAAVIAAATAYTYSYPGLAWLAGTAGLMVLAEAVAHPRRIVAGLRLAVRPLALGLPVLVALVAPESGSLQKFASSSFAHEPVAGMGNLVAPIPAAQALGIWLRGDFRYPAHPSTLTAWLDVAALAALAIALVWWLWRRDFAGPAALASAGFIAWQAWIHKSPYNTAKALAILGAAAAFVLLPALADAWRRRPPGAQPPRRPLRALQLAALPVGLVLAGAAATSTLLALRDAPVSPPSHTAQLERLAQQLPGRRILFMGIDDYAEWELRGTRFATIALPYTPEAARIRGGKAWGPGGPVDPDLFSAATLNGYHYAITTSASYMSAMPPNFRLVTRTPDFLVWERKGRTPHLVPMETGGAIGDRLDCASPRGRYILGRGGTAYVIAPPVALEQQDWANQPVRAGSSVTQKIDVPAGTWDVSLQYAGGTGYRIEAPGLRRTLPASLDRLGPFWPAGTLVQRRSGPLEIRITALPATAFARLLHAPAATRALNSRNHLPLGRLTLTPKGARPRPVPIRAACGRYVDHYRPGG